MACNNGDTKFPKILIDKDNDFASIRFKEELEERSYLKEGVVFSEDKSGNIIEVQILNLKSLLGVQSTIAS